jgi:catechol 2,3-dioxygenase-like lactoylglutathione lyase family enzyme
VPDQIQPEQVQMVGFDHIVLNVSDPEASLDFYCNKLGCGPVRVEEWRAGKNRFPSARVNAHTILDLAPGERSGQNLDHFCLVVEPMDLVKFAAEQGLEVLRPPQPRYGAQGEGVSIYVHDPDRNVVEIRYYE